jgi:hypothetical protein
VPAALYARLTLALKVVEHVKLNQKVGVLSRPPGTNADGCVQTPDLRVTACYVATYCYVDCAYIVLRRYPDTIRSFVWILNLCMRKYHTRSYQYDPVRRAGPYRPPLGQPLQR